MDALNLTTIGLGALVIYEYPTRMSIRRQRLLHYQAIGAAPFLMPRRYAAPITPPCTG
jgi:hypothetical protein